MRPRTLAAFSILFLLAVEPAIRAQRPLGDDEILGYLNKTIVWYRSVVAETQSAEGPRAAAIALSVKRTATEVLRLAFDFARAQAATAPAEEFVGPELPGSRGSNLARAESAAARRADQAQADLDKVNRQFQGAGAQALPLLRALREETTSELNFAKARRDSLRNLIGFFSAPGEGGLSAKIGDLERSVPDAVRPQPQKGVPAETHAAGGSAEAASAFNPQTAGIIGLTSEIFSSGRKMAQLGRLALATDDLRQAAQTLRAPLRKAMQEVTAQADAASRLADSQKVEEIEAQKQRLDDLLKQFKSVTGSSTPLSEQAAQMTAARVQIIEWRDALKDDYSGALRYLLLRIAVLVVALAIIFGISEIWRRTTLRYVRDPRRRRQVLLLRRVVVGCFVAVFVLLSFVTEFGSLATFAGFSAAGLAVALQSVLVSAAAYFFLVGRWGVRVGDRITVSGVTGDVIDIGLFRLYLMELGGAGLVHPTGRIVVFPNAVFFQPSAMFKQLPGIEYVWRTLTVTVAGVADYAAVEGRVLAAVERVYAEYRDAVERQHKEALASANVHAPAPHPESRVRLVDSGLQVAVRYPVQIKQADQTDDRVVRAVVDEIDRDPKLTLAAGGAPKIEAAAG